MSTRSHALRVAVPLDREWGRLLAMIVAVILTLGVVVFVASLGPDSSPATSTGSSKSGKVSSGSTVSGTRVGGHGSYQYKVLP
jgi:hypothetical protein